MAQPDADLKNEVAIRLVPPRAPLSPEWDSFPATLRRYARWHWWILKDNQKKPRAVRWPDVDCDATVSRNWCSWETLRSTTCTLSGPGFACGKVDKDLTVSLIDLDNCRDPHTGIIQEWAWKIIRWVNSYTEVSPSGTGIHIFVIGALPPDAKKQQKVYKLEIYDRKRFSTVTGHRVEGTPDDLQPREKELCELYAEQQCGHYIKLARLFGLYLRHRNSTTVDIICPWAEEHSGTDGPTDAAFRLEGDKVTGFHCFHASHQQKTITDVRRLLKIQDEKAGKKVRRAVIVEIFAALGYQFEHDIFADKIYFTDKESRREVDDAIENHIFFMLEADYNISPPTHYLSKLIDDLARERPIHPVRIYLDGLTWDGIPRLDQWLVTYAGAEDTPLTRAIGAIVLIAAVRRVRQPGCLYQEMVVFESDVQGRNKSTAVLLLCPNPDWFTDSLPLNCGPKETIEQTGGKWIIEAGDLAGMRRSEIERLKVFLARSADRARGAYARKVADRPRHFILIGTTNEDTYMKDQTGNRRFWPIEIEQFDLDLLRQDRDQLWAEAAFRESQGESIRLDPKFYDAAEQEQEKRRVVDPWERIFEAIPWPPNGKQRVTYDAAWSTLNVEPGRQTPELLQRLKTVMKKLGFREMSVRNADKDGAVEWGWGRDRSALRL